MNNIDSINGINIISAEEAYEIANKNINEKFKEELTNIINTIIKAAGNGDFEVRLCNKILSLRIKSILEEKGYFIEEVEGDCREYDTIISWNESQKCPCDNCMATDPEMRETCTCNDYFKWKSEAEEINK